jgi:hypothetical protein
MVTDGKLDIKEDSVVLFEADGRNNPRDIGRLLLALERGHDMVIASRFIQGGARHDRHSRFKYRSTGNRVMTLLANLLFYSNFSDALNTFRAVKRSRLHQVRVDKSGLSGFYQLSIKAMKDRWKVGEVPTVELVTDESGSRGNALLSVFPLLGVLSGEFFRGSDGKVKRK